MKLWKPAVLLLCIVGLFSGCAAIDKNPQDEQVSFYYLQKEPEYGTESGVISAEIRQASGHRNNLSYMFSMYFQGPTGQSLVSPFPEGLSLVSVSLKDGTLELTLSPEFTSLHSHALTLAYACIARTAVSVCGTDTVHIIAAEGEGSAIDIVINESMFLLLDDSGTVAETTDESHLQ